MNEKSFGQEQKIKPGGDWLTRQLLSERLSRSYNWVVARTSEESPWCEERLADNGSPALHFHPGIEEHLRQESEREKILDQRDYVTAEDVAVWLGMEVEDAILRIKALGIRPIERTINGEKINTYYPTISMVVKSHERAVLDHTYQERMAVGSLEAQIRAKQRIIEAYVENGAPDHSDVLIGGARIAYLQDSLIDASNALDLCEDEVDPMTLRQL